MSLEARNAITPQMADYDRVGDQWVPYLMRFDRPNRSFESVTTNEWGFRTTLARDGHAVSFAPLDEKDDNYRGIVVGSSAVFGVGATHDRHTIPSVLNRTTNGTWLNYGGRAFNSTQELLLFLLHLPKRVDHIVLFSGVNNITLAFLSDRPSRIYNSLFSQTIFERAMANPAGEYIGLRRAATQLAKEIHHRFFPTRKPIVRQSLDSTCYEEILTCFRRDLTAIKALGDGLGASVHFALQPLATWIDKDLSPEESKIFQILDGMSQDWEVLAKNIHNVKDRYFDDVAGVCADLSIPYTNINLAPSFKNRDWLFVDRVHLTDQGYGLAADIIKREFSL